ncbi:MAG: HD domain-containing phosphohydrolase [Pseudomonadota bacterium]
MIASKAAIDVHVPACRLDDGFGFEASDVQDSKILLVDDETVNLKLLQRSLEALGYSRLTPLSDPYAVVPNYEKNRHDLVVLDLNMPGMNGFEILKKFHALGNDDMPSVLVLTAQHAQEDRIRALRSGAQDYITKPFSIEELAARVRNLLHAQLDRKLIRGRNLQLEQRVFERTQELYDTRLQIVRRLGRAAEYRDNETGLHIVRMSKISALLGDALGMGKEFCDLLLHASPMHDIGKIGIPDCILLKPGRFESHEWEVMKSHTTIGADILSGDDCDILNMAREIALTHHEKWDGSGYPLGLIGVKIPLEGRIVAIADVFDALISERPYKKAWEIDSALEFIQSQRERHFDPELVDLFIGNLSEILKIWNRFAEPAVSAT